MRVWVLSILALVGLAQAQKKFTLDPPKVEYAVPWTKGPNICAYIARFPLVPYKIYSYCLPWKQDFAGKKSGFRYDCCPGFKRTDAFGKNLCLERERTWKTIPDLLKIRGRPKFAELLTSKSKGAGYTPLSNKNERVTHTVFAPYSDKTLEKSNYRRYNGQGRNHPALYHVTKGRTYAEDLRNGQRLKSVYQGQDLKVTKYSNGIICIECRELVEPNHEARNGVFHYFAGPMTPPTGNRKSLMAFLRSDSQTKAFARAIPSDLQRKLSDSKSCQWYTVFAPTDKAWREALKKYPGKAADLARACVIKQMYCSASLIGKNVNLGKSEAGDNIHADCDHKGKRILKTTFGPNATVVRPDLMAGNGVAHVVDSVLTPSKVMSLKQIVRSPNMPKLVGSSLWPKILQECDLLMKNGRNYAVMIPNQRAFDWWEKYRRFKKYWDRFLTDKKFRCRLARFHVAEMRNRQYAAGLPWQWLQQSGYKSTNPDNIQKWEVDYFKRQNYGTQFFYHYSPIYPFRSYPFQRGSIYFTDRVNMIPEKRLVNVLADTKYLSTMSKKTNQDNFDGKVFRPKTPLNLYLAIRNRGWQGNGKAQADARSYKKGYLHKFLLLHWVNNWLWGGDIGYFEPRSRHRFMSGAGIELIFDRQKDGTMYIGYKGLPRNQWAKVVQWNLYAIDGNIWVLDRPLICPKKICGGRKKLIEREIWKVLSFACWESLRAARGAKAKQLEPWLDSVQGDRCFTNRETPRKESSSHGG